MFLSDTNNCSCAVVVYSTTVINSCTLIKKVTFLDAGVGDVDVVIEDPNGNRTSAQPHVEHNGEGSYRVSYTPKEQGPHNVHVTFAGVEIPKSPFEVPITLRKCIELLQKQKNA